MGAFYGTMIKNGEINPDTGEAWTLDDVRLYWRPKVKKWLEAEGSSKK